jgi:hypothetical protein
MFPKAIPKLTFWMIISAIKPKFNKSRNYVSGTESITSEFYVRDLKRQKIYTSMDLLPSQHLPLMMSNISEPFGAVVRFSYPLLVTNRSSSIRTPPTG